MHQNTVALSAVARLFQQKEAGERFEEFEPGEAMARIWIQAAYHGGLRPAGKIAGNSLKDVES